VRADVNVAIIGAGQAGLSTSYYLSAVLYGVGEDAQLVAEHIVANRR
jgi:glycine/D-amino acid oxidase-like deaminating enzyme